MRVIAAGIWACLMAFAGAAAASEWIVRQASQPAHYTADGGATWLPLEAETPVPDRSTIHTGPRGRALLGRGEDTILFRPDTLAAIGAGSEDGRRTTEIVQRLGAILVEVETRDRPHTQVRTPFLAAVVKGTAFEVVVGEGGAEISVSKGIVEVIDIARGERTDLVAQQSVRVHQGASGPMQVQGPGPKAAIEPAPAVPPAPPAFRPSDGLDGEDTAEAGRGETGERRDSTLGSGKARLGIDANASVALGLAGGSGGDGGGGGDRGGSGGSGGGAAMAALALAALAAAAVAVAMRTSEAGARPAPVPARSEPGRPGADPSAPPEDRPQP